MMKMISKVAAVMAMLLMMMVLLATTTSIVAEAKMSGGLKMNGMVTNRFGKMKNRMKLSKKTKPPVPTDSPTTSAYPSSAPSETSVGSPMMEDAVRKLEVGTASASGAATTISKTTNVVGNGGDGRELQMSGRMKYKMKFTKKTKPPAPTDAPTTSAYPSGSPVASL